MDVGRDCLRVYLDGRRVLMFEYRQIFLDDFEYSVLDMTLNKFGKLGWRLHTIFPKGEYQNKTKVLLERKVGDAD